MVVSLQSSFKVKHVATIISIWSQIYSNKVNVFIIKIYSLRYLFLNAYYVLARSVNENISSKMSSNHGYNII